MHTTGSVPIRDYRRSHIGRGRDYDENLSRQPWARYMALHEKRILNRWATELFPAGIPRYIDFACGTGRILRFMQHRAAEAYGIDVSESMLSRARDQGVSAELLCIDVTTDPLYLQPVDLITAFRFLGNAQHDLRNKSLRALSHLIRPGGYLVFNNHKNAASGRNLVRRMRGDTLREDLTHSRIKGLLADHGFRVVQCNGIGWWLLRSRWSSKRYFDAAVIRWLEPLSHFRSIAPFCPDAVYLAQRVAS